MLVIRMQRTGRKGHAQFRVVVQDSRRTPTSGKIIASIGHFDPHTKQTTLNKEKATFYLDHGAQPSDRVARLLKSEGVKLPTWVKLESKKSGTIRNQEKLRKNRPAGEPAPVEATEAEPIAEEAVETEAAPEETPVPQDETIPVTEEIVETETPPEEPAEQTAEETPAPEPTEEKAPEA